MQVIIQIWMQVIIFGKALEASFGNARVVKGEGSPKPERAGTWWNPFGKVHISVEKGHTAAERPRSTAFLGLTSQNTDWRAPPAEL